jgi:hypothetical protein
MNRSGNNRGALIIIAPLVIALIVVGVIYDPFHIISSNSGSDSGFAESPVWVWVIGVGILASVLAYGISQGRSRSRGDAELTQQATRNVYRSEEADRERHGQV